MNKWKFIGLIAFVALWFITAPLATQGQSPEAEIARYEQALARLDARKDSIQSLLEGVKLAEVRQAMDALGYPTDDYLVHSAMVLSYDEEHEQARWVMHAITPDVIRGSVGRTNDFRPDPKVATGSAVEADYFIKTQKPDGSYEYDGFGFDRGHLAPSADFRWSYTALSESYYYSNMSPQRADFNRGGWADLEDALRAYVYRNPENTLYVVTLPVLHNGLPKVERSVNGVSVPETYIKVALDPVNERGIAFAMPNTAIDKPLASYAISIREAERISSLNFFPAVEGDLADRMEQSFTLSDWLTDAMLGDAEPLYAPSLPRGHFNTTQAARHVGSGKEVTVCGTVVGTRTARSGNVWLNLDRQYPNQVFSVYIRKEHLVNFSYDPERDLKGEVVCIKAKVSELSGTPTMRIENEKAIQPFELD
jgi:endonuclease G